jgi:hypothetical protein
MTRLDGSVVLAHTLHSSRSRRNVDSGHLPYVLGTRLNKQNKFTDKTIRFQSNAMAHQTFDSEEILKQDAEVIRGRFVSNIYQSPTTDTPQPI